MTAFELPIGEGEKATATAEAKPADPAAGCEVPVSSVKDVRQTAPDRASIDKGALSIPEPRRVRDKAHRNFVSKQPCLVCGRQPAEAHHLRHAQHRALGRKVSDEFTVPLCRTHHREVHSRGDEAEWWKKLAIDPFPPAATLWAQTRPLGMAAHATSVDVQPRSNASPEPPLPSGPNYETNPISTVDRA